MDILVKENIKYKKNIDTKHSRNLGDMKKGNLRIIDIKEWKETQVRGTEDILNKTIKESLPNLRQKYLQS